MTGLTSSYVCGTSPAPLRGETMGNLFDRAARRWADRPALVARHQNVRWTFADLAARVDAFAAGLLAMGLEPGDRLGIWAPNCAEWVVAQFASAKAGLVLVNVNPAYRLGELEYALTKVGCRALITANTFKTSDYIAMLRELAPEADACGPGNPRAARLPELRWIITLEPSNLRAARTFTQVAALGTGADRARLADLADRLQFDDPINIQFTSGTTGTPKAATLTHHAIINNADLTAETMAFTPADRLCLPVPMYHCFGMVLGTLACLTHGSAVVFPGAGFDAGATIAAIEAERCTALHGVPTMFIAALDHPDFPRRDLTSLRTGIMAGAPCPEALMRRVMEDMHLAEITIAYGMTETGPVSFQTAIDDPLDRRVGTVGRVLPHTEVKVVDADGRVVPMGTPGELLTRGYCVMRGYWGDAAKTAEAIDNAGWMHSGDMAVLDEAGYGRIVGRLKDMIIRGGENIFPREIEEFLYAHPKVDAVEVFGVPDPRMGEEICAWIKLRQGEIAEAEEIRAFCRERIAHFKIPRYVRFVESFPMTVTGKVQKYKMRETMAAELEASGPAAA